MKNQDKATAGDLSDTDLSNIPSGEFKAMIIKILSRLSDRVMESNHAEQQQKLCKMRTDLGNSVTPLNINAFAL